MKLYKIRYYTGRIFEIAKKQGIKTLFRTIGKKAKKSGSKNKNDYAKYIKQNESFVAEELMGDIKFSILVPLYNTDKILLKELVDSLICQNYKNFEIIFVDGSTDNSRADFLNDFKDNRIIYKKIENKGIAENTIIAAEIATGDYLLFVDHDDLLAPNALYGVYNEAVKGADFIYTDEDKIDIKGSRFDPHFKPSYSPYTIRSYNYISHLTAVSKKLYDKIGGVRAGFDGAQDFDFVLRATDAAKKISHIEKVLYHWRVSDNSTAQNPKNKQYTTDSGIRALNDFYKSKGIDAIATVGAAPNTYNTNYNLKEEPLVSVIIPNKDNSDYLKRAINSLLMQSYKNIEIIIVENNSSQKETFDYYEELKKESKVQILSYKAPFNYSAINNFAVERAGGELLFFLNNDIKFIDANSLHNMVSYAVLDDVGAVGAKLYYPDDTIQHAGIVVGLGGVAGHVHKHYLKSDFGYFARLCVAQELSAVTAAAVVIGKEKFRSVGGFEERLSVAFNDVDLSLKLKMAGYRNIFLPNATLYHYESKSRGNEDSAEKMRRFRSEIDFFKSKHKDFLTAGDPHYNKNLSLLYEDFSIKLSEEKF